MKQIHTHSLVSNLMRFILLYTNSDTYRITNKNVYFCSHLLDVLHEQEKSTNNINCGGNDLANLKYKTKTQVNEVISSTEATEGTIKRWITEEDLTEGLALQQKTQSLADFPQSDHCMF